MPGWLIVAETHRGPGQSVTTQFRAIEKAFREELVNQGLKFDGAQLRNLLAQQYPGPQNEGVRHALDLWLAKYGI